MSNNISLDLPEAIILCGGKGEILRPINNDIPKPLVKINNKPILHYVIEHLKQFEIGNINIACGYKSSVLKKYFSENKYDINIDIYDSGDVDIIKRIQDMSTFYQISYMEKLFLQKNLVVSILNRMHFTITTTLINTKLF